MAISSNADIDPRQLLILGALLHNIGKFWQRTGLESDLVKEFEKGEVGSHGLHAIWSGEFFRRYVIKKFPALGEAGLLAQFHHNPKFLHSPQEPQSESLAAFVQQADRLSSKIDRDKRPKDDPKGSPTYDRLAAITAVINNQGTNQIKSPWEH